MAMSGSVESPVSASTYLKVRFDWSVSYNLETMKATWKVSATVKRTDKGSYSKNFATVIQGTENDPDYITFNGTRVKKIVGGLVNGNWNNPYVYTGDESMCNGKIAGPYTGGELAGRSPYGYAYLLSNKQFTTDIDDNGHTELRINSLFRGGYAGNINSYNGTITPTTAEVFSKIPTKSNGSWTNNGRIWYKDPVNHTWKKKFLYRKTNGTWKRV